MKSELYQKINEDKEYYYGQGITYFYRRITHNPLYCRGKYIIICRKLGYHQLKSGVLHRFISVFLQRKKNILGEKLHIELGTNNFRRRLRIYHNDIVINGGTVIGDDCELYGNNCIGNKGSKSEPLDAPIIGNSVSFGVGAKAIGRINICDNVQISSMSLVNHDIMQRGVYGGIPARKLKSDD